VAAFVAYKLFLIVACHLLEKNSRSQKKKRALQEQEMGERKAEPRP